MTFNGKTNDRKLDFNQTYNYLRSFANKYKISDNITKYRNKKQEVFVSILGLLCLQFEVSPNQPKERLFCGPIRHISVGEPFPSHSVASRHHSMTVINN